MSLGSARWPQLPSLVSRVSERLSCKSEVLDLHLASATNSSASVKGSGAQTELEPILCLLTYMNKVPAHLRELMLYILTGLCYAKYWRKSKIPKIAEWESKFCEHVIMA